MQISPAQAVENGWLVDYDSAGRMYYMDGDGNVINPDTGIVTEPATGSVGGSGWFGEISQVLTQGLSFAQAYQQQKAFNEANKQRAAQGLAPLPWSDFRPTASVGVTADPKILWTVAGVGLILALALLGGGRRGH